VSEAAIASKVNDKKKCKKNAITSNEREVLIPKKRKKKRGATSRADGECFVCAPGERGN
jgi:hypothetical protein